MKKLTNQLSKKKVRLAQSHVPNYYASFDLKVGRSHRKRNSFEVAPLHIPEFFQIWGFASRDIEIMFSTWPNTIGRDIMVRGNA